MTLRVERAETAEERRRVFAFRYRIYVDEMGIRTPEADTKARLLSDPLDERAVLWMLTDGDDVLGTLRVLALRDLPEPGPLIERYAIGRAVEAFGEEAICISGRFMLDSDLRRGTAILRLLRAAFQDALARGIRLNYGDCSPSLLPFYERMGFRRYTRAFIDTHYGFKVPILMLVRDREHFEAVGSPFERLAREAEDDPEVRDWFARSHPEDLGVQTASLLPEGVFFDLLGRRVATDPLHALGILRGLDRAQADRFLAKATVIRVEAGQAIVRQGELGDTLFVLVSGAAEVLRDEAPDEPVGWLAAGDSFGETGFLTVSERTASVVARAPSEAVVLSGEFLRTFLDEEPVIASRVLMNLARELAERLADANRRLAGG